MELTKSELLNDLAEQIIETEGLNLGGAKIEYLFASPNITKKIGGKTIKTNKELNYYSDADFIIEISQDVFNVISKEDKYNLLFNQLLKVGWSTNENNTETKYYIAKPDIVTFNAINKKNNGHDWFYRIRECNSSLYDLNPKEADLFSV